MHSQDTIDQFIQLRAQDRSYDEIAQRLRIGKATAVDWGRKYKGRIHNLQVLELDAVRQKFLGRYEDRVKILAARLQRFEQELDSRQPKFMPTLELQRLIADTRQQLDKLVVQPAFVDEPAEPTTNPQP